MVLGASENPERYSNKAILRLRKQGHSVIALGKRVGQVSDVPIITDANQISDIDTVTLYLNADRQKEYYDLIQRLKPRRIIFNPGAENSELSNLARDQNIEPIEACTLVMLSMNTF